MGLVLIAATFVMMWMLFIRPQQRRMREHRALVSAVEVGDEIMTTSGLYGTVTAIDGDDLSVELAPGTVVRMVRGAIGRRIVDEPEPTGEGRPSGTAADRAVDSGDSDLP
jgi:preprotein translocase subunit YajC